MGKMQDVLADGLQRLFNFIGESVQFTLGLLGVISVTALSLSGEVIDDLTTYRDSQIDYYHLAKVMLPPIAVAVAAYIQHKRTVATALATAPPEKKP